MTIDFALEYIPRRMRELGVGDNYHLRIRQVAALPGTVTELEIYGGEFLILVEDNDQISIESDTGFYDRRVSTANEIQYEHQGKVLLSNQTETLYWVRFIQVIPSHNSSKCKTC